MYKCDQESLVVPLLGLWSELTVKVNSFDDKEAIALHTVMFRIFHLA